MKIIMNQKLKDFVILPRKIKNDFSDGKLTKNEYDVLVWIWFNANPYNGSYLTSYEGLRQDLRKTITYDNCRKIISSLRKAQYIYFSNHRGRKGSFPIYPIGFVLTTGQIQSLEYLKNKGMITSQSQPKEQQGAKPENNSIDAHHNFKEQKDAIIKQFSMNNPNLQITTSYNDNENKNDKESIINKTYKKIDVKTFLPHNYEEQKCWEIAKSLGETDMRFILSCLRKYKINHIERVWGIFKEIPKDKIQNPRKYFNKLIRNLAQEKDRVS